MMARPQKKPKTYHNSSTSLEDLDDHMLTQILCRLPFCAAVLTCTLVNKRWCSLIYDPNFAIHFFNHKTKTTHLSVSCSDINDDEPPWTFVANLKYIDQTLKVWNSSKRSIFASSKFSLNFLPRDIIIEATFKDLVLCSDLNFHPQGGRIYYLCNPLTKQWITLPPCPGSEEQWYSEPWTGLICKQSYDYTRVRHNKFRVVVIRQRHFNINIETYKKIELRNPKIYKLWVYCSEVGKWKKIKLSVAIRPELVRSCPYDPPRFEGCIVCDGVIYIKHTVCLAGFDPFNVHETCNTTISARVMPTLPAPVYGCLRESAGKLFSIYNSKSQCDKEDNFDMTNFRKDEKGAITLPLIIYKLDPNQLPLQWHVTFEGLCTSQVLNPNTPNTMEFINDFRMHPYNERLIYMYFSNGPEEQFAMCDTRSGCIKPLESSLDELNGTLHRLELQLRPTSVHTTTPLNNASQWQPTSSLNFKQYELKRSTYMIKKAFPNMEFRY